MVGSGINDKLSYVLRCMCVQYKQYLKWIHGYKYDIEHSRENCDFPVQSIVFCVPGTLTTLALPSARTVKENYLSIC